MRGTINYKRPYRSHIIMIYDTKNPALQTLGTRVIQNPCTQTQASRHIIPTIKSTVPATRRHHLYGDHRSSHTVNDTHRKFAHPKKATNLFSI